MTEIAVYDRTGEPRSLAWARDKYGPFVIYPAPPGDDPQAWKLTALREKNDSAFVATVREADGSPQAGVRPRAGVGPRVSVGVCFYWPDAPTLQGAGPLGAPFDGIIPNRAVSGYTNTNGNAGFGMGPGAHYDAASGERGPHAAWIHGAATRSDVILGLGMIPDDHLHLNAEWTLLEESDPTGDEDLIAVLHELADNLHTIAHLVKEYANV